MYIAVHKSKHLHSFNFWCPQVSSQMFCSLQLSLDIDTDTSNTSFESLYHRWRSRLISECRHAIRTRDATHGMLQVARIESVSSVLRQKHTAVGEFRTHTSFENRLGGPTLNHLRYGVRLDIELCCFFYKLTSLNQNL